MNPPRSVGLPMNMAPYQPQPLAPYYPQPLAPFHPPQPAPYYPPQPAPHHPPTFPPHLPPFQAHPPQGFWQNGVYWQPMLGYQQPPQPQQQPAPPLHSQEQMSRDAWYGATRDHNNALDHPEDDRGYGQDTRSRRRNPSRRSRSPNARARDISPPRHRQRDDHFGRWDHSGRQSSPSAHSRGDAVETEKSEELCRYFPRGKCRNGDECDYKHDGNAVKADRSEQPCRFFQRGTCGRGEGCDFKHDAQESNKSEQKGMGRSTMMDSANGMARSIQPQQGMQLHQSFGQNGYRPAPSSMPQAQMEVQPQGNGFQFPLRSPPRAVKREERDESPPGFIELEPEDD